MFMSIMDSSRRSSVQLFRQMLNKEFIFYLGGRLIIMWGDEMENIVLGERLL